MYALRLNHNNSNFLELTELKQSLRLVSMEKLVRIPNERI